MIKKIVILLMKNLPTPVQTVGYNFLWRVRKTLYKLQRFHPARGVRLLSSSSLILGPPKGIVEGVGACLITPSIFKLAKADSEHAKFIKRKGVDFELNPVRVFNFKDARVCGSQGAIVDCNDNLVADVSLEIGRATGGQSAWSHSIFSRFKLPVPRYVNEHIGVLCAPSSNTYFHWLFDVLPRIGMLQKSDIDSFLVGTMKSKFQKESLDMIGVSQPVMEIGQEQQIRAKELTVLSRINRDSFMKETINFLRESLLSPISNKKPSRLFVSRQGASYRKLTNYLEIKRIFDKWGIEELKAENLTFRQQIEVFQRAELVIAPHGSGLSNIVFCNPGTVVLELFSEEYTNPLFYRLASQCDLQYDCVIDGVNFEKKKSGENIIADVEVSANQVEELLKKWLT